MTDMVKLIDTHTNNIITTSIEQYMIIIKEELGIENAEKDDILDALLQSKRYIVLNKNDFRPKKSKVLYLDKFRKAL